jgi:hypothetical protein
MTRALWVMVVALLFSGCATPRRVPLDQLLMDGKQNEIAAYESYRGAELQVTGIVATRGLRETRKKVADITHGPFQSHAELSEQRRVFGYVTLIPERPEIGRAICYFEPDMRADAGRVEPGQRVTLNGYFTTYQRDRAGSMFVQLDGCELAD